MAIGDVVSFITAVNTVLVFQPAAGVEVAVKMINSFLPNYPQLIDGVLGGVSTAPLDNGLWTNMSMMINNAIHLQIGALGPGFSSAFCGIEIA